MSAEYDLTEGQRADAYLERHNITAIEVEMLANLAATLHYLGTDLDEVWREVPDPDAYAALIRRLGESLYPTDDEPSYWFTEGYSVGYYNTPIPHGVDELDAVNRAEYVRGRATGKHIAQKGSR